jgi:hypothetical protein
MAEIYLLLTLLDRNETVGSANLRRYLLIRVTRMRCRQDKDEETKTEGTYEHKTAEK